ncbi:MAG: hypothetical protein JNL67_05035 [Planctomycetaceae bacterium]|nr:hypothetical protein [Planctomycetaceae bacterium]
MRSIVTMLLIAAFGVCVGCGGETPAPAKKPADPAPAATTTDKPADPAAAK